MSVRFLPSRWIRPSLLTALVSLCLLTCTGTHSTGNDAREGAPKVESIRDLEQKTVSLVPPLVQATVGLTIMGGMGAGSGVVVSEDGLILSAGHVVPSPGQEMIVHFSDGRRVKAKALGSDKQIDAGLAKIVEEGKYPFVKMGKSANLKKGDWVLAIGNPGGYRPDRKPPVRLGRVLSLPNKDAGSLWIRTDATVAPGDSGGPLFNMDGEVVGIHSNISPDPSENRHVAVDDFTKRWDAMMSKQMTGKMFSNGNGSRPQLGIHPEDRNGKVRINDVVKDSPAEKAGLQTGDIILKLDGSEINKADEVFAKLRRKRSGNEVKLTIAREGDEKEIVAKLGEGPRTFDNPNEELEGFLQKYGYKRADGVWEYQPTPENEADYRKILARAADRRNKAIANGELKTNKDDFKNSPKLVEAFTTMVQPINKSMAFIFNGKDNVPGEFDEKPSVLGTIISNDGYILTKASELKKDFYCKINGAEYDAKLIGKREDFDLALLKVDAKNLNAIKWASQSDPTPGTIMISPTLDSKSDKQLALSIVSNAAREISSSIAANKAVLGVQFAMDSEEPRLSLVTANGPADKAGIKRGDLILSVNGKSVSSREKIQEMLSTMKPGDKITLEVKRTVESTKKDKDKDKDEDSKKDITVKIEVRLGSRSEVFANQANGRGDFQTKMFATAAGVSKRNEDFPDALTHDAALTAKQMGGPLLNLSGQAIGLNIARYDRTASYAIPYKTLQPIIEKLMEEGKKH